MNELRIMIVADDPLARAGLAALLGDQPELIVSGQVDSRADLVDNVNLYQPDVILWDLGWNPETALEQLADWPETELPVLALLPDDSDVNEIWSLGIRGLLARNVKAEKLQAALGAVAQGVAVIDPPLVEALLPAAPPDLAQPVETLTPRESEVLQLLAEGLPNKAIARKLDISDHTVKFHVNAIMGKLGAQSRTEAVVRATRLGLILL